MQHQWLPETFLAPRLSRVRNIGPDGLTMRPDAYDQIGFALNPISAATEFDASSLYVGEWVLGAYPSKLPIYVPPLQFDPW
jgi:hypothetical protein